MSESIILKAEKRELVGKKVENLRDKNFIPAVVYGSGINNTNLSLNYSEFDKVFKRAGESTLIDLVIDNQTAVKVIVQDIAYNPLNNLYQHIDFYQVRMDKKLKTNLAINFFGESPAVKEFGAVLVKNIDEIEIECLPQDLQHQVDVNLEALKQIGDKIIVSDLNLPKGIEVLSDPNTVVALVEALHVEEIIETSKEAEAKAIESVEAEKEKKSEDDEKASDNDDKK